MHKILAAILLTATLSQTLASAQTRPETRLITADATKVQGPHSQTPLMTIGAGRANEGLRADWQQQLALVQKEIGFHYIRFHGLLHDDMGVYTEDAKGTPSYNFQYIDALYDALLAQHIRPFVELSFMPAKLASGDKTVFWWKGNITPPKDMAKWNGLIHALIDHWQQRYGTEEISKWYYEVWNEPDLDFFWSGTEEQYLALYKNTAQTIKSACPTCRVGGPASALGKIDSAWLTFIAQNHVPADFLATHTYGVTAGAFDSDGHAGTVLDPTPTAITGRVQGSYDLIHASATPNLELHYTEWSTAYTPTDPIHDQYISAPFILQKLRETSPAGKQILAQSMSYWTFTDIFEENGPRFTPFHGGFGLINYQGIRKPSYFAYKFLAQLGKEDLATTDSQPGSQSWITRSTENGKTTIAALLWNYTPIAPPAPETDQIFYKKEQPAKPAAPTQLTITNLPNGSYNLSIYRTGYQQNDPYTAYLHMGSPTQLTRQQVTQLQQSSANNPTESSTIKITNHQYQSTFETHQNDTVLVTLTPQ